MMTVLFDEQYPNIAWWVQEGRIEIGRDEYGDSFIRAPRIVIIIFIDRLQIKISTSFLTS